MAFLQAIYDRLESSSAQHEADEPQVSDSSVSLFISTDLEVLTVHSDTSDIDIEHEGKVFRRLDPAYFTWLRSRMKTAQAAHKAGKVSDSKWESLKKCFNPIQEKAIQIFGKDTLLQALNHQSQRDYNPPQLKPKDVKKPEEHPTNNWIYPGNKALTCMQPVTSQMVAKVDAIRDKALAKKWSEARLYQNQGRYKFPCGEDYGLVCFVDEDKVIGAVTERYIEIIHGVNRPRQNILKFYNPDVPQPWFKKSWNERNDEEKKIYKR